MFMVFRWVCDYELLVVFAAGCWLFLCVCVCGSIPHFPPVYLQYTKIRQFGMFEGVGSVGKFGNTMILLYIPCNGNMAITITI